MSDNFTGCAAGVVDGIFAIVGLERKVQKYMYYTIYPKSWNREWKSAYRRIFGELTIGMDIIDEIEMMTKLRGKGMASDFVIDQSWQGLQEEDYKPREFFYQGEKKYKDYIEKSINGRIYTWNEIIFDMAVEFNIGRDVAREIYKDYDESIKRISYSIESSSNSERWDISEISGGLFSDALRSLGEYRKNVPQLKHRISRKITLVD